MPIPFVKMHGIGNDYLYIDAHRTPEMERLAQREDWKELVGRMSDRHKGVGSDGVILVCRPVSPDAHARMRMFNADGSESQMCGNGVRCVAKFVHDRLGVRANPLRIQTGRGTLQINYTTRTDTPGRAILAEATVDMGEPILEAARIPVALPQLDGHHAATAIGVTNSGLWREELDANLARELQLEPVMSCVSMGNPHCVLWSRLPLDLEPSSASLDLLRRLGPLVERHPFFPQRTNVHVCARLSRAQVRVLTWERGSGITQACGTGACAVAVAGALENRLDRHARVDLLGGSLTIEWSTTDGHVRMTGPAQDVCEGFWPTE